MRAQIIFLHGASSSGKSTLGAELQAQADRPFWRISIDTLRDGEVLPMARIKQGDFQWSQMRGPVFDGFHRSLAAYAAAGNNLILEHILDTPHWADQLKQLLAPFDVLFVGVHCDLPELNRREVARADRPIGSAEQDFHNIHQGRVYDIDVSNQSTPEQNAARILALLHSGQRKSEFTTQPET